MSRHNYYHHRRGYQQAKQSKFARYKKTWFALLAVLVVSFGIYRVNSPIAIAIPETNLAIETSDPVEIAWPSGSQSAIGDVELGVVAEKPGAVPLPTASVAKLITALVVLEHKPLAVGETGPTITMTDEDVDRYNNYYEVGGSTAIIREGQELSQYQLLQGILILSSNNYADSLAIWAFGSHEKYQQASQQYLEEIGAHHTKVGADASGLAPDTISTPHDMVLLGIKAYQEPVLRQIMKQASVELPLNPLINNTNWLLGESGVVGGKTGNSDEAKGVFVGIGETTIADENRIVVVAVQASETKDLAMNQSLELLELAYSLYQEGVAYQAGDTIANYQSAWGENYHAIASQDLRFVTWNGKHPEIKIQLEPLRAGQNKDASVGQVEVDNQSSVLMLDRDVSWPSMWWRLTRAS